MPADHTSKREAMQKKVIDCPISNHEPRSRSVMSKGSCGICVGFLPVSVTLKKNVMVMTVKGLCQRQNASKYSRTSTIGERMGD